MIFRWLKRRRELSARVSVEAETMIALLGDGAYYEARERSVAICGLAVSACRFAHAGYACYGLAQS
jgi:hypothetical protein